MDYMNHILIRRRVEIYCLLLGSGIKIPILPPRHFVVLVLLDILLFAEVLAVQFTTCDSVSDIVPVIEREHEIDYFARVEKIKENYSHIMFFFLTLRESAQGGRIEPDVLPSSSSTTGLVSSKSSPRFSTSAFRSYITQWDFSEEPAFARRVVCTLAFVLDLPINIVDYEPWIESVVILGHRV